MFSADLSWSDGTTEKVGQRRERQAKRREHSVASSGSSLRKNQSARKGSLSQFASFSSVKGSFRRPSTEHTVASIEKPSLILSNSAYRLRDPVKQPNVIYSTKLEQKLPSGAPIDVLPPSTSHTLKPLPVHPIYPEQRPGSPNIIHQAWSVANRADAENLCQSYEHIKTELLALYHPDDLRRHSRPTFYDEASVTSPVELDASDRGISRCDSLSSCRIPSGQLKRRSDVSRYTEQIPTITAEPVTELSTALQNNLHLRQPKYEDDRDEIYPPVPPKDTLPLPVPTISQWKAPQSWDIIESKVEVHKILDSESSEDNNPSSDDRNGGMGRSTHFQRFVRRMESAGPKIILDRLQEDCESGGDRGMSDELRLEKHLWALTAVQLQCMDRFSRQGQDISPKQPLPPLLKRRRKILELDGSIGEIYQLSAIYPDSRIHHFTSQLSGSSIPLPKQAIQHPVNFANAADSLGIGSLPSTVSGILPLPYADASVHHVRATRMSVLVPVSRLSQLLAECYRVLKPGGVLELRLMDATPDRRSMGPLLSSWLDDRLLIGLEQEFRCQRPTMFIPRWAREVGFLPLPVGIEGEVKHGAVQSGLTRCLRLPAATSDMHDGHRDVVAQVGALVSQVLWKDAWGTFVTEDPGEPWWWDVPDILEECREWKTTWDVSTLIMMKEH